MSYAIKVEHVSKHFKIYKNSKDKFLDLVIPGGYGERFVALNDISFELPKGEVLGLVGVNGSGKSTLSNLISGVTQPSHGKIKTDGDVSLVAISSGLNGNLSGRDNIELKGLMLGLTPKRIKELEPDIIEFADIGRFIDQPVKNYSSGMKSRLGFAISVHINPNILVIDEALSVGDQTFTDKCLDKMNEFKDEGKTIVFVSHSIAQVRSFCTKVLWLEYGVIREYGDSKEVLDNYGKFLTRYKRWTPEERKEYREKMLQTQYQTVKKSKDKGSSVNA